MMASALWALVLLANAQVAPQASAAAKQASLKRMVGDLTEFELSVPGQPDTKLELSQSPVLRWNNPIRSVDDAGVFVWLNDGRPEALATVMSYRDRPGNLRRSYELLSLSPDRITALQDGRRVWRTDEAGLSWSKLTDAPAPAATAAERRRQLYELAAQFKAAVQQDKNRFELRLLAQPLSRYSVAKAGILDGALFALVEGTDPELILAIEATDDGHWRFAAGRLTRWRIEVQRQEKVVAEFQEMATLGDASEVYHIWDGGPLDPAPSPKNDRDPQP
jgi:hypothetical protein